MAASRALIDFGRPTNNGITICGKTTTSRNGSSGSWVGAVTVEVVVMAGLIKNPVDDVGTSSRNTSPGINKKHARTQNKMKKATHVFMRGWLCDVSLFVC
jgi:hypothetical protein